jgi:hypothetical protein
MFENLFELTDLCEMPKFKRLRRTYAEYLLQNLE